MTTTDELLVELLNITEVELDASDQRRGELRSARARILRQLKAAGWSWRRIGDHLGITPQRAHQLAKEAPNGA